MMRPSGRAGVRFLILMTNDDAAWDSLPAAEQGRVMAEHEACEAALRAGGHWLDSWRLRPAAEARTETRAANGAFRTAIGAGARGAQFGGAYLIEAASMEEAQAWARRLFIAGANEVREVWE